MPDKKDYDDELVQLLARGELPDRQIAKRLGLSPSQVSRIARGEIRGDLQPKILAAMRKTLKEAWKNGGHLDPSTKLRASKLGTGRLDTESPSINSGSKTGTADGEASPATPVAGKTAKTAFDRHLAVELIASGQLTLSKIAERLGVHKTTVSRIMAGRSHPELQGLIREAEKQYRDRARRIGVKWSAQIVTKQIQVGLKDNGWVGLRARQDLLDRFLGPEDERAENEVPPAERDFGPELRDLPEPLKSQVVEALGGPAADQAEDEYVYWNDPSTWKPVGAAAEKARAAAAAAAQEDPAKEPAAAALEKKDVAQPPSAGQEQKNDVAQPPSAEQEQKNDVASRRTSGPSPKQEETTPLEEGCSRNKKRRRRQRREVDSFIR